MGCWACGCGGGALGCVCALASIPQRAITTPARIHFMLTSKPTNARGGDIFSANDARIVSNLGLAHLAARRVWAKFPRLELDDLFQEAILALFKASRHFD